MLTFSFLSSIPDLVRLYATRKPVVVLSTFKSAGLAPMAVFSRKITGVIAAPAPDTQ
jgi:hypothetical protein